MKWILHFKKLLDACKRLECTKSMRDFIVKDESQPGLTTRQMTLPKSVILRSPDFTWLHVWQAHSELCIHRSNIGAISKITQGTQLLNLLGEQPYYLRTCNNRNYMQFSDNDSINVSHCWQYNLLNIAGFWILQSVTVKSIIIITTIKKVATIATGLVIFIIISEITFSVLSVTVWGWIGMLPSA